ncbi:MAG: lipopolysaccharide assembly protein LapB [Gammaproteobacteria bacterium]
MSTDVFLGILIILFLGCFFLSRRFSSSASQVSHDHVSRQYLVGLNYLLNEEPDKALEQFIKMLEVDSDTVETHLALGSLFRRRGEVDRAIHIHQNLIARPHLSAEHRTQALLALGEDYFQAGVYDRAENLFYQVMEKDPYSMTSIRLLLNIYQQEQEWEKAITTAQQLQNRSEIAMNIDIAHFHCEIAQLCWDRNERERCYWHLRQAVRSDKNCVRASLMQAEIEIGLEHYKAAIKQLQQIENQDPKFIVLALPHLVLAYKKLHKREELQSYLKALYEKYPFSAILQYLVQEIHYSEGLTSAMERIELELYKNPSIQGLQAWMALKQMETNTNEATSYTFFQSILDKLEKEQFSYQCEYCGITSKELHWYCRGCNRWSSIKPQLS